MKLAINRPRNLTGNIMTRLGKMLIYSRIVDIFSFFLDKNSMFPTFEKVSKSGHNTNLVPWVSLNYPLPQLI